MPGTLPGKAPGYRPRRASNPLQEIVEDSLEELLGVWEERFRKDHGPLHPRLQKLFQVFCRCGDPHFGFLRLRCPACAFERLVPHSCKARGLCPSCGKKRALAWAERMVAEVLPHVPFVQLVFTIPKMLRPYFLWDRSLYGELSRVAYSSTLEFLRAHFPSLEGAVPAMVVAPQSHGSLLNLHPHLHSVVSLGLFDRQGSFHCTQELDFSPLEEIFRQKTLRMMLKKGKITPERADLLRSWSHHSGFHLNADRRLEAGDRKGLESLLEYMERAPVALERLECRPDGLVLYRGNFHPGLGIDRRLVTGVEFLALLVPHVLLRFEVVIRSQGAASTTIRRKFGWIAKDEGNKVPAVPVIEGEESAFVRVRRRNWARLIAKVWLEDPSLCPKCGEEMKVLSAISSPAQDDVIEKILRARGKWDPPWLRSRPPRGPPTVGGSGQGRSPDGETRIEYDEGLDPRREDWEVDQHREIGPEGA